MLILGGSGFIGRGIFDYLISHGNYEITVADIDFSKTNHFSEKRLKSDSNIKIVESDFTIIDSFSKLDTEYDYVYMLASIVGVNKCIQKPHEVIRVNTALIQNSLEWLTKNNIGKILFSSSSECYAATTDSFNYSVPTSEEVPLSIADIAHPRFTYAVTKMFGESAFLTFGKQYSIPTTIVRYQNIFGPEMGFGHVIPHLVERFCNKNEDPFKIYGADQTRAFCYITDASEGTVLAMENKTSDQQIFHIGNSDEISIKELVKTTGAMLGYNGSYENAQSYPGSVSKRCPDISKAQTYLKYNPKVNWVDGLQKTVDWYSSFFKSKSKIPGEGFKAPEKLNF